MDDLISRNAAVDALISQANHEGAYGYIDAKEAEEVLMTLPSSPRWIPVTERLPKNYDCVIVTILDERGDTPFKDTDLGWYFEETNCWIVHAELRRDVVAWMPLPTPWKGESDATD